MDATLNDFLNEIEDIAPLEKVKPVQEEILWHECFDEKSGFSYYWNIKTDEVTWNPPKSFKPHSKNSNDIKEQPACPGVKNVKIYKIDDQTNNKSDFKLDKNCSNIFQKPLEEKTYAKKRRKSNSDDDIEKISLISSYGGDTSSEEEDDKEKIQTKTNNLDLPHITEQKNKKPTFLQQKTAQLKEKSTADKNNQAKTQVSGFSLVAGYSDSEDDEEVESINKNAAKTLAKQATSTLFPIVEPVNINDFSIATEKKEESLDTNVFDTKNFQRKRRLGVNFKPLSKTLRESPKNSVIESKSANNPLTESKNLYANFMKGGIEFTDKSNDKQEEKSQNLHKIKDLYELLCEKLGFLCEGHQELSPVQIIKIQIQTLNSAFKDGSLNADYLEKWLKTTSEDLIKLEKETAPEGFLLQWDRSFKRYYYQNVTTGEGQWEYPQPDVDRMDEEMDISTTPPPEESKHIEDSPPPPLPPQISSPSPPPPPLISQPENIVPEPPEPPKISQNGVVSSNIQQNNQPLPPGVDFSESNFRKSEEVVGAVSNDLNSALNSFYSDLASIETADSPTQLQVIENPVVTDPSSTLPDVTKKKKKKGKITQGLSMKKKDVSKLVEKWKNVHF